MLLRRRVGHAVGLEPADERVGQGRRQAEDHQREEDPDREHLRGVLEGLVHAAAGPAVAGAAGCSSPPARLGEANMPIEIPISSRIARELGVGEVGREQHQEAEARRPQPSIPPVANGRAPKRSER